VRERGDRGHLRDQADRAHLDAIVVVRVRRGLVEGRQRRHRRGEDAHRVGVHREAVEEPLELLVEQRVVRQLRGPVRELALGRQLAIDQQVCRLDERRAVRELLDRIPAVAQDAGVAVEIGDRAAGRRGVCVPVIEGGHVAVLQQ
jgi:hypothetical protein